MSAVFKTKSVLTRKALHFLIALAPLIASFSYPLIITLICAGIIYYAFIESFRNFSRGGLFLPGNYIAKVINLASHKRDKNRFVLGPLSLGAGALLALIFFNEKCAEAAIYALAFGDGFAGLAGKAFGKLRPRFLAGKSIEGSAACFVAIFASSFVVTREFKAALACALTGTLIEVLPLEDFDNILIPLAVGAAASMFCPA